ncbi:MAG: tetratricopeptide repeat protein [Kiritimatiellia bacterium]
MLSRHPQFAPQALRAALVSGVVSGVALMTCLPFWLLSTRSYPDMTGLILMLLCLHCSLQAVFARRQPWISLASLLFGLGLAEFASFIGLLPVFFLLVGILAMKRGGRFNWAFFLGQGLCLFLGFLLILETAWFAWNSPSAEFRGWTGYATALWACLKQQHALALRVVPAVGWLSLFAQTYLPLLLLLALRPRLRAKSGPTFFYLLLSVLVLGVLFDATFLSPMKILNAEGRIDLVFGTPYVAVALSAGLLAGIWWSRLQRSPKLVSALHRTFRGVVKVSFRPGWPSSSSPWAGGISPLPTDAPPPFPTTGRARSSSRSGTATCLSRTDGWAAWCPWKSGRKAFRRSMSSARIWRGRAPICAGSPPGRPTRTCARSPWSAWDRCCRVFFPRPPPRVTRWRFTGWTRPWWRAGWMRIPPCTPFWGSHPLRRRWSPSGRRERFSWSRCRWTGWRPSGTGAIPSPPFAGSGSASSPSWPTIMAFCWSGPAARIWRTRPTARPAGSARKCQRPAQPDGTGPHRGEAPPDAGELQRDYAAFLKEIGSGRYRIWSLASAYGMLASPEAYADRGMYWAVSGLPARAVKDLQRAMELSGDDARLRVAMADALFMGGDPGRAAAEYARVLQTNPADRPALLGLARLEAMRGEYAEARARLSRLAEGGEPNAGLLVETAVVDLLEGLEKDAAKKALQAVDLAPADPRAWTLLALLAGRSGDAGEFTRAIERMQRMASLPVHSRFAIAALLRQQGRIDEARRVARSVLETHPGHKPTLDLALKIAVETRDHVAARQCIPRILEQDPADAYALMVLGSLYYFEHHLAQAEDAFRASLKSARSLESLNSLAYVLSDLARFEEALPLAEEALSLNRLAPETWDTLAMIQLGLRRPGDALVSAQTAVGLAPENLDLRLHLAVIHSERGELDPAWEIVEQLMVQKASLSSQAQVQLDGFRVKLQRLREARAKG